ncbi:hypothetical protein BDN70DRAFT_994844 [Pholiota conissans]|uniref:Nicotinamide N-methyltransferase n=1 Tax=Pholiota conissans TaxID=109636 RepID=A0A9P5YXH9_9AGAR|nr:hypothetical protein BDN70DRAFT_994844 [Pholiota conissans]
MNIETEKLNASPALLDPEDFLSDSLQTLYDHQPIVLTTSGAPFTYTWKHSCIREHEHGAECKIPVTISLRTPDTAAANWALQASSIWASSTYLADHLIDLNLDHHLQQASRTGYDCHVLELGASAGLPSILIAKLYPAIVVTATDYPDDALLQTLSNNVRRNSVAQSCTVFPFAWGTDPTLILGEGREKFDVIIAADTLWNPDLHEIFVDALKSTLRKTPGARIHIVVGLHTGRYTVGSFLKHVSTSGFDVEGVAERQLTGTLCREWDVDRENEDDQERRKWIVWIQLKWTTTAYNERTGYF